MSSTAALHKKKKPAKKVPKKGKPNLKGGGGDGESGVTQGGSGTP